MNGKGTALVGKLIIDLLGWKAKNRFLWCCWKANNRFIWCRWKANNLIDIRGSVGKQIINLLGFKINVHFIFKIPILKPRLSGMEREWVGTVTGKCDRWGRDR